MNSTEEQGNKNQALSRKDKFWVTLAIVIFLILFVLIFLYGDGIFASLF